MSLSDYAKNKTEVFETYNIIEFASKRQGLGIELFPSQRFFLKVFEKMPLDDTISDIPISDKFNSKVLFTLTERGFYNHLYEDNRISLDYDTYFNSDIIQFQFAIGRRGTKSTTFCIYIAYKLYQILLHNHPQKELFNILEYGMMNVTMTALGQTNANKLFAKFYGIIKDSPFFQPHLLEEATTNTLKIWTKFDIIRLKKSGSGSHTHSIEVNSVPNTPGTRGEDNVIIAMEEFAHFNRSASSTRQEPLDEAIYKALTPSVSGFKTHDGEPFGRTLILSSPNGKIGKFYEEFKAAFKLGVDSGSLAIQAPTWECNPEISSIYLKTEYTKSPISFDQEFGAKFIDGGVNWIRDLDVFYQSFDSRLNPITKSGRVDRVYFLGLDFALSNDGTSAAICHFEPNYEITSESFREEAFAYSEDLEKLFEKGPITRPCFVIDYAEVRYPGQPPYEDHKVLLIDELMDWIESLFQFWPIQFGIFDQWSGEIISQAITGRGMKRVKMVKHTADINDSQYKLFSQRMYDGSLKLPHSKAIERELLSLNSETRNHGMIKVEAPPGGNHHDDWFDAVIRALYLCYYYHNKTQSIASGLPELYKNYTLIKKMSNSKGLTPGASRRIHKMGRNPTKAR